MLRYIKELAYAHPDQVTATAGNQEEMMLDYYRSGDKLWPVMAAANVREPERSS
ncbi:hypothetical protein [Shouchella tritolerans]|uniref:hypothetical protein n=1 Tax=Shouchella tritolerans TaxID=2979466 RepID=UPI0021E83823|nr:hypothetical protein [Shouchella tritolerans]